MEKRKVIVKEWFVRKSLIIEESRAVINSGCDFVILKETEKAVFGYYDTDFGRIYNKWVPKSCVEERKSFTPIEINGRFYVKEVLMEKPQALEQLGLTREQVAAME